MEMLQKKVFPGFSIKQHDTRHIPQDRQKKQQMYKKKNTALFPWRYWLNLQALDKYTVSHTEINKPGLQDLAEEKLKRDKHLYTWF